MNGFELRDSSDRATWILEGIASRVETPYRVSDQRGCYQETIAKGAFGGALATAPKVRLLIEHDRRGPLLARTGRNLALDETSEGHLHFRAALHKDDPEAASAVSKVRHGLLDQMSFSFLVAHGEHGQTWDSTYSRRRVHALDLDGGDVSLVVEGANPSTHVSLRSGGELRGSRELAEAIGFEVCGAAPLELRARYSAHELDQLGKQGMAFPSEDGGYSFPTKTRADVVDSIHQLAAADPRVVSKAAVRAYLVKRARALGAPGLVPCAWRIDGSIGRSATVEDVRIAQLRADATTAEAELMCPRARANRCVGVVIGESVGVSCPTLGPPPTPPTDDEIVRLLTSMSHIEQLRGLGELQRSRR